MFFDICERHIERAMEDLETRTREEGEDKTLLELFKGLSISITRQIEIVC